MIRILKLDPTRSRSIVAIGNKEYGLAVGEASDAAYGYVGTSGFFVSLTATSGFPREQIQVSRGRFVRWEEAEAALKGEFPIPDQDKLSDLQRLAIEALQKQANAEIILGDDATNPRS